MPTNAPKKTNAAFAKPLKPSPALAEIVGSDPLPRTEVVSKMWDYIRANGLQNPENKREIVADAKLRPVLGADRINMFEMNRALSSHLG